MGLLKQERLEMIETELMEMGEAVPVKLRQVGIDQLLTQVFAINSEGMELLTLAKNVMMETLSIVMAVIETDKLNLLGPEHLPIPQHEQLTVETTILILLKLVMMETYPLEMAAMMHVLLSLDGVVQETHPLVFLFEEMETWTLENSEMMETLRVEMADLTLA